MANTMNKPTEPAKKATLSEGTRDQLARYGHAQSFFTGALLVGTPENFREVDQEEYTGVAKEAAKRANEKKESNLL